MPHASVDRGRGLPWRSIAELPAGVDRILAFVPDNWCDWDGQRSLDDDRVCIVERTDRGWFFNHYHGGFYVEPTMFCLIDLPEGAASDPR